MWDNFMTMPTFVGSECDTRNGYDPELWFPDTQDSDIREVMEAEAIAVCWTCSVRQQCLTFAMEQNIKHGIWGGYTAAERKVLRLAEADNTNG